MIETLVPLRLPPGLFRNGTKQDAAGRWYDANLVRWVEGYPQPVGGWRRMKNQSGNEFTQMVPSTYAPRTAFAWRANNGDARFILGNWDGIRLASKDLGSTTMSGIGPTGLTTGNKDAAIVGTGLGTFEIDEADCWTFDNFGEALVAVLPCDGRLWNWVGPSLVTAVVTTNAPTSNRAVVVTPERFLVALGAGGNVRKVQWADQESSTVWTPTISNQAGDFELATNGRILCGARTKQQTLIWTDTDMHTMTYIGGTLVYSFAQAGDNCGIVSSGAKAVVDTQAFWMGRNNFFVYDGFVRPLPCDVHDYVFENFNATQASKVWATTVAEYSEVWWFYVSSAATEIDRYVVYNYRDGHWSFGSLARTCGIDAGILPLPAMVSADRFLYEHEVGEARTGATVFLESGPITLDPDRTMRIQRLIPDGSALADTTMSLYTSMFPVESETLNGPYSAANPTDVRLTAKHVRLRINEADDVSWRVGIPQLGVLPLGRR